MNFFNRAVELPSHPVRDTPRPGFGTGGPLKKGPSGVLLEAGQSNAAVVEIRLLQSRHELPRGARGHKVVFNCEPVFGPDDPSCRLFFELAPEPGLKCVANLILTANERETGIRIFERPLDQEPTLSDYDPGNSDSNRKGSGLRESPLRFVSPSVRDA